MAIALNQFYFTISSSDLFWLISLGGGTAPVLYNMRTGSLITVDAGALGTSGSTAFTQYGSTPLVSPLFNDGDVLKCVNPAGTPVGERVSPLFFTVVNRGGTGLGNVYIGILSAANTAVSSAVDVTVGAVNYSILPEFALSR